jgi:phosphoenolpyruvate carboxykinase (ATP)
LQNLNTVYWNLTPAALVEQIILRQEATISNTGSVVVNTGSHTGRSPNDKFIVNDGITTQEIWWGKFNQAISGEKFRALFLKMRAYLQGKDIFVQDLAAGAEKDYQLPLRVITEKAWTALFAYDLFIRLPAERMVHHIPEFTIFHCPDFHANPSEDGTNSSTLVALDLERKIILISGTSYAGEVKKSIFTVLNFVLPRKGVLPMHCSANVGKN